MDINDDMTTWRHDDDDDDDDERSEEEETSNNDNDNDNNCDDDDDYLVVVGSGYYVGLILNCALIGCSDFEFDNTTPYRDETIDKTRLKCGPMNAEEWEDSNGPLTSLIRWVLIEYWAINYLQFNPVPLHRIMEMQNTGIWEMYWWH